MPIKPISPAKKYNWSLEMLGFEFAEFSKCSYPEVEVGTSEFNSAGSNYPVKTAGRLKYSDIEAEKGVKSVGANQEAYLWLSMAQDPLSGIGQLPVVYKKDIVLIHKNEMSIPVQMWTLVGAWVKKIGGDDFEGGSDDAMIEKLTISYDYFIKTL